MVRWVWVLHALWGHSGHHSRTPRHRYRDDAEAHKLQPLRTEPLVPFGHSMTGKEWAYPVRLKGSEVVGLTYADNPSLLLFRWLIILCMTRKSRMEWNPSVYYCSMLRARLWVGFVGVCLVVRRNSTLSDSPTHRRAFLMSTASGITWLTGSRIRDWILWLIPQTHNRNVTCDGVVTCV